MESGHTRHRDLQSRRQRRSDRKERWKRWRKIWTGTTTNRSTLGKQTTKTADSTDKKSPVQIFLARRDGDQCSKMNACPFRHDAEACKAKYPNLPPAVRSYSAAEHQTPVANPKLSREP